MEVSGQLYRRIKSLPYPLDRRLGEPQSEEKKALPLPGIEISCIRLYG
jgi:hypothetical protein